jgi:hypothetical protein
MDFLAPDILNEWGRAFPAVPFLSTGPGHLMRSPNGRSSWRLMMFARIGLKRALNRHQVREFNRREKNRIGGGGKRQAVI